MVLNKSKNSTNQILLNIRSCQNFVKTLNKISPSRQELLDWFKELCNGLINIINAIGVENRENKAKFNEALRDNIILYLIQLITTLSLLTKIFIEEDILNLILIEARNSAKKQIEFCLEGIGTILETGEVNVNPSGTFVKWMDDSLETIARVDVINNKNEAKEICKESRKLFEEVLSHAMSIAQVSLTQDCKMIRGSCQSVLESLSSLNQEIQKEEINPAMVNLFVDSCSNKLCSLERKVNTSVLKLCLSTFSRFSIPLQNLHDFCFNHGNNGRKEELDNLIVDFDLHVDRIMQIGLFAVSCSSDVARGMKIRSCLASLEALESELVPVFTAVLTEHSIHNVNCALVLEQHWLSQALCLQQLIYLIIDPFAFCQVIHDESREIVDNLSYVVKQKQRNLKLNDLYDIINIFHVLKAFLEQAKKEFDESEIQKINQRLPDFLKILDEVSKASKILLENTNCDYNNDLRILKRCKILLTMIKRIWVCFAEGLEKPNRLEKEQSIKELSPKLSNLKIEPTGNAFLDHIIQRGKQIIEERSILYKTPKKSSHMLSLPRSTIAQRNQKYILSARSSRNISFINTKVKDDGNLESHLSGILREIVDLSTTFNNV